LDHIRRIAKKLEGSGIVYASTRKAVEEVSRELRDRNLSVASYHAGMKDAVRIKAQEDFMTGRKQIIVATNAFGMGIDKPDIRFVVHYQMPGSIEAYYQEIGRAGRDGLPASCHLLFNYVDKNTHDFFIDGSYPEINVIKEVYDTLVSTGLQRIELSSSEIARRASVKNEMAVQSSLYLLERAGHIERTALPDSRYQVDPSGDSRSRRNRTIIMLDNPPVTRLRIEPRDVSKRADLERRKLREMIDFCYTDRCYRAHILDYFGDRHHSRNCGTCGNCAPKRYSVQVQPDEEIFFNSRRFDKSKITTPPLLTVRALSEDELLRIRKILACAKRMKGRFGKKILVGTIRGSAAKNVMKAQLNELSTYGLLRDVNQDVVSLYVESLIRAGCLVVSKGEYPTIGITEFGERVMREQAAVELLLPATDQ
jgi:ATP-dependent DNA helicase RecQ